MRNFFINSETGVCFEYKHGLKRDGGMSADCKFIYSLSTSVDIEKCRKTALQWLNEYIDELSNSLLSKYSKAERDTFAKKQKQAVLFLSGDFSDCAMLSAECAVLGHALDTEHCQTILSKAAVSDQLWGLSFGLRQLLELELQNCLTIDAVQSAYDAKITMIDAAVIGQNAQQVVES